MATICTRHGVPLLACTVAVLALTWPLAPRFATALPNAGGDGLENTWNIWWAREALLGRHSNPFWASTLYYPDGTSLYFHPLGLAAAPISLPLQQFFDPPTALILTLLALVWLLAVTTYALLWDITHHRGAALFGGLFVALAPAHLYHLLLAQVNLVAFFPVPFVLFAQRRAMSQRHWGWLVAAAAGVVVCALADWQYALQVGLLAGFLALAPVWRGRWRPQSLARRLLWGVAPLALAMLVLAPLVLAMLADLRENNYYALRPFRQTQLRSADLLAFVAPNPYHPLWGQIGQVLYATMYPTIPYAGGVASFGFVALAAVLLVVWRRRRAGREWLLLLIVGLALSLGPSLRVFGHDFAVPMPYAVLQHIPYFDVSRVPAIFLKWSLLAIGVLLALATRQLMARCRPRTLRPVAFAALAGLVVVESIAVPLQIPDRPPISACYRLLADDPRPGAVLDLPVIDANEPMYFQAVHRREIAGGDLSRDNPYPFLFETPPITQVVRAQTPGPLDIYPMDVGAMSRGMIAAWGIRWIVLRPRDAGDRLRRFENALARHLDLATPLCADDNARLWRLDSPDPLVLRLNEDWLDLEALGARRYRWFGESASAIVYAPSAGRFDLSFSGWAHAQPRLLEVWADGQRQAEVSVPHGGLTDVTAQLMLPAGRSLVELRAVEPPAPGGASDERLISVAVSDLRLSKPAAGAP